MSQPVDFDLNLGGNYNQSMGQAVALSSQYADVAEGIRGKVGNLSNAMVGLTNRMTGFNRINTVATDTAAGYQKALSNIESTAVVTGKSFDMLSASTRKLARDFPIGIAGAVDVVESLQSVGVKSEQSIARLGKSFVNLGAATNSSAAGIGRDMTLLGKSFGNGVAQFDALSDSLVTVTKQLGASAPATVAFSKALAPIASTVGMGQTAVMGLSAAMSSLGEDGYRAANVFNKVLLDMHRSVRDGGPELKAYADLMGTTSDKLRTLFSSNPTEMLTSFTEALGKSGAESQRMLESLGFDSVRDTRSLQALSRSGGLRSAVATSVAAYGSGSTQRAAEPVLEGVLDSAEKLRETMSQTVQNLGAPLMGIMKNQLNVATSVAGLMEKATGSSVAQSIGTPAGVMGMVGGTMMNALTLAVYGAMAKTGFTALSRSSIGQGFRAGTAAGGAGFPGAPRQAGMMGGAAANVGWGLASVLRSTNLDTPGTAVGKLGRMGATGLSLTAGAGTKFMNAWYGNILRSANGAPAASTPEGQRALAAIKAIPTTIMANARGEGTGLTNRQAVDTAARAQANMVRAMKEQGFTRNMAGLGSAMLGVGKEGTQFAGGMLAKTGARLGGLAAAMPFSAPMAAALVGAGAGMWAYGKYGEGQENLGRLSESSGDIYSAFNSFAEATGQAGRGLMSFQAAVQQSTDTLVKTNTTMAKALDITSTEAGATGMPGYKTAFNVQGGSTDPKVIAAQLTATLGEGAAPEDVARGLQDVTAKFGAEVGRQVSDMVKPFFTGQVGQDYGSLVSGGRSGITAVGQWFGASQEQVAQADLAKTTAQRRAYEVGLNHAQTKDVGGMTVSASGIELVKQAGQMYEAAQKSMQGNNANYGDFTSQAKAIAELFSATEQQQLDSGLRSDMFATDSNVAFLNGSTFKDTVKRLADAGNSLAKGYLAAEGAGLTKDYSWASGDTDTVKYAKDLGGMFETATNTGQGFTESLYAASDAATSAGKSLKELPQAALTGMGSVADALGALAKKTDDKNVYAAGKAIMEDVLARTGGNTFAAQGQLQAALTNAPSTQPELTAGLQSAIEQLGRGPGAMQMAQWGPGRTMNEQIRQGWQAQQIQQMAPSQMTAATQMTINTGQEAESAQMGNAQAKLMAYGQLQAGIAQASRSAGIQMASIARDGRLKEQWATEDYNKQTRRAKFDFNVQVRQMERDKNIQLQRMDKEFKRSERYADEDHQLTRRRAVRDFTIAMDRVDRDAAIQRTRATRDYNKGVERANRDFAKQEARANEDYQRQRVRAEEDYNKSVARATRDFGIQQMQATEDFNKSRTRALEDYNKQVKRMVEDSAKQMYDPYKRIAAQMVMDAGQLVTNLKDQTAAINKQVGNLAQARAMGLSEEAIKALNLADASNAQQLQRIVEDARGNPEWMNQLNTQVGAKNTAASALVTDQGNTAFARTAEDFATQMARGEEDFTIAQTRAAEAFARSMSDGAIDFATSMARMREDFALTMARSRADFDTQMSDQGEDFKKQLADMADDVLKAKLDARLDFDKSMLDLDESYGIARTRALEQYNQQVAYIEEDHDRALGRMERAFNRQMERAEKDFHTSIERMRIQTANAISDVGAQLGAQISSMKESFASWLQTAGMGVEETATAIVEMYGKLGIDESQMGQADKDMLEWANMTLAHINVVDGGLKKLQDKWRAFGSGTVLTPTPVIPPMSVEDPEVKKARLAREAAAAADSTPGNPVEAFVQMGKAAWDGFIKGVQDSASDNLVINIFEGFVSAVKGFLGIHSPSTVFAEIGKNLMEGLKEGILAVPSLIVDAIKDMVPDPKDVTGFFEKAFSGIEGFFTNLGTNISTWATAAWNFVVDPIKDLHVVDEVTAAFDDAAEWLGSLGDEITTWIGTAWTSLTDSLPPLTGEGSIAEGVEKTFADAKGWIIGLAGTGKDSVVKWIGNAWDAIIESLPSPDDVFDAVKGVFGIGTGKNGANAGVANFFEELLTTIKGWIPPVGDFTSAFSTRILDPFRTVLNNIIDKWNNLSFTFPEVRGDWNGPLPGGEFSVGGWTIAIPGNLRVAHVATGGILTRPTQALMAEGGYPEAVIPLNDRGAQYFADVMNRYANGVQSREAMVAPYSSPVTYNTYTITEDYSTKVTGPITVQAQDPDDMMRQLEAKQARSRLSNTVGSR